MGQQSAQAHKTPLIFWQVAATAAIIADAYSLNVFNDWFLPSKDELDLLFQQKSVVGGFASAHYWSSSEDSCI